MLIKDLGMVYKDKHSTRKHHFGIYKCPSCKEEYKTYVNDVNNGKSKQCKKCSCTIHGLKNDVAYICHKAMMHRCYSTASKAYKNYGARGISVCEEWHDIHIFKIWFNKNYIDGYDIDRKENNKNYTPDNCRFVTQSINMKNRRGKADKQSEYDYVIWDKRSNKWRARIRVDKKDVHLGYFIDDLDAKFAIDDFLNPLD